MNLNDMVKNAYSNAAKSNDNFKKSESSPELQHVTDYLKTGGLIKVTQDQTEQKDSIFRRVAKFLLIIGEDEAAKILPHLSEEQIEKIIPEIASIRSVDKDEADSILAEFNSLLQNARQAGGVETAREMLTKVYGKEKANQMLEKTVPFSGARPFDYLSDSDSERIYILLKDEKEKILEQMDKLKIIHKLIDQNMTFTEKYQSIILKSEELIHDLGKEYVFDEHLFCQE